MHLDLVLVLACAGTGSDFDKAVVVGIVRVVVDVGIVLLGDFVVDFVLAVDIDVEIVVDVDGFVALVVDFPCSLDGENFVLFPRRELSLQSEHPVLERNIRLDILVGCVNSQV